MALISFGMAFFFKNRYLATKKESAILQVESKSLAIDGFMSLALGVSFLLISLIPLNSPLAFLHAIGDALLVIILSVLFLKTPVVILKNAFIEIGGGALQNQHEKQEIIDWIGESLLDGFIYDRSYISKTGSSYLAVVYLKSNKKSIEIAALNQQRIIIEEKLKTKYSFTDVELILN